jgi:hypothetical protein
LVQVEVGVEEYSTFQITVLIEQVAGAEVALCTK